MQYDPDPLRQPPRTWRKLYNPTLQKAKFVTVPSSSTGAMSGVRYWSRRESPATTPHMSNNGGHTREFDGHSKTIKSVPSFAGGRKRQLTKSSFGEGRNHVRAHATSPPRHEEPKTDPEGTQSTTSSPEFKVEHSLCTS